MMMFIQYINYNKCIAVEILYVWRTVFRTKHLIKQALCKNPFLKNLNTAQISEIVDVMYPKDFEAGAYVIRKGDPGKRYTFFV